MLFLVSACFKTSKNLVGSSKMSQKESKDNLPDYLIFLPDNLGYLLGTLVSWENGTWDMGHGTIGQRQNVLVGDGFAT